MHRTLVEERYRPGPYRTMAIHEPKRRLIAASPVRDRIVHHAIYRVLSPLLDRSLIDTTFACLPDRGSHRAVLAFQKAMRRHRFVLTLDIRHYFLSIDQSILMQLMRRRIKDERLLRLMEVIATSGSDLYRAPAVRTFLDLADGFPPPGCGLPIGNLTSQWWANHYLSGLDHFVKRSLKIEGYQRYMDDFTLFADSRAKLEHARLAVIGWLRDERRLRLKRPHVAVRAASRTVDYLGYRVSRCCVKPRREVLQRMERRVSELVRIGDRRKIERSIASYRGVIDFAGTTGERQAE